MFVLVLSRVSSRVSGFPVASPCLCGKPQNLSFSKVSKEVVMSFCVAGVALCDIPTCLGNCPSDNKQDQHVHHPLGVKSMCGPDTPDDQSKGHQKGKPDAAGGSYSGKGTTKPDVPINAANVVHKTACKHWPVCG